MFNKLFGQNTNFDTESKTSIVEDSIAIRQTVDYIILRAAWDEYVTIKKHDEDYIYGDATPTPAWEALKKVEEYGGDLSQFGDEEQHLLRALRKGFLIYADVLHVLIDHHDDKEVAEDLFDKYPQLHDAVPQKYDNLEHIIDVVIEIVRDYQWQLEQFSTKHKDELLENITRKDDESLIF